MFKHNYSFLDRCLHRVAFHGGSLQLAASEIESFLYSKKLDSINAKNPVFITSLPRAGTTLLLELLFATEDFATHKYSDMPFILCPLIWSALSAPFRSQVRHRERAHGDGMDVSTDSPEAFEEILWRSCWPNVVSERPIRVWSEKTPVQAFRSAFEMHMRKVIYLRRRCPDIAPRYISKNNANISRLKFIRKLFPDATIVIPFRNPADHIDSLFRQHVNFTALHAADPFSVAYMNYLGHLEFGQLMSPINFDSWTGENGSISPNERKFWEKYWTATFSHLTRDHAEDVLFFDYDRLRAQPARSLTLLAQRLFVDARKLVSIGNKIVRPAATGQPVPVDVHLESIYHQLQVLAINSDDVKQPLSMLSPYGI